MFDTWDLLLLILLFSALLFALAFWGNKHNQDGKQNPVIYSLALGVHCTSWAFYGTTTQAIEYGWAFIPTYLGIILVMLFAHNLLIRIARLCHQHQISSLADFISFQYKQSHGLGILVSLMCFFGVVPYIALQLDALTSSMHVVAATNTHISEHIGLYITLLMAIFAILFGTRNLDLTARHPGLMLTIAFASVLKLLALVTVGLFVCYVLFDGVFDLLGQAQLNASSKKVIDAPMAPWIYLTHVLLGACAMLCLPRQFHINFIENNGERELHTARWLFPAYLIAMTLFVLPIALAGQIYFQPGQVDSDTYVLALPVSENNQLVTLLSLIGGLSAAISMIIIATLALGIMIANNLITPIFLKLHFKPGAQRRLKPSTLLLIRRLTVVLVLMLAYIYHVQLGQGASLVKSGIISLTLLAQFVPVMLLSLYWKKANKLAAFTALITGAMGWFYWLLWPSIKSSYYFDPAPTDMQLSLGFILSLGLNLLCFVVLSQLKPQQAETQSTGLNTQAVTPLSNVIRISSLRAVTEKLLDKQQHADLVKTLTQSAQDGYASPGLLSQVEQELSRRVGRTSARVLLSAIAEKKHVALSGLVEMVEEASQVYHFNHELLQSSVQHIHQGICVIDPDLKLLAWNKGYQQMFDYPDELLQAGTPIRELLSYNLERGLIGNGIAPEKEIDKRLAYLQQGSRYKYIRTQGDKVIELNGSPLPGGGFVTTYSDISEYIQIQRQLEDSKLQLETRVEQRTQELAIAKRLADEANESKSRFLAAAGHDLMQPFNAATLFASMLSKQAQNNELQELTQGLLQSLNSAEELLNMLLDMTRLESGSLTPKIKAFALDQILAPLCKEFSVIAQHKGLQLKYVPCYQAVTSDPRLLRRIVQNLLSNAIRYTDKGKILVGVRRVDQQLQIQVVDTGIGIAAHQQQEIFREFHQLEHQSNQQGLGLGLTIVERMSQLLKHQVKLVSKPGKGTCFSVCLDKGQMPEFVPSEVIIDDDKSDQILQGKHLLLVENEPQIQQAMLQLLTSWGARVNIASNIEQALADNQQKPDLLLLDYHLDKGCTGLDAAEQLNQKWQTKLPGIVNSADRSEELRELVSELGLYFLPKPVKPLALKRLIKRLLD